MKVAREPILVLGGYRQTLAVLRSLTAAYESILGCQDPDCFVTKSKYVSMTWVHPTLSDSHPERFFACLEGLLRTRPDIRLIFPVGDAEILFLAEHQAMLPPGIRCVMPDRQVVAAAQQKTDMFRRVTELGIPTANYKSTQDGPAALLAAAEEVGFPCVIKPENESSRVFGAKAYIALTSDALRDELDRFSSPRDVLPDQSIVQKYCAGGRRNIYFFAAQGHVLASVEIEVDRTDQWDGTGYAVEGHTVSPDPQWASHLSALAKSLNYHGAGCLQYVVDPKSGTATFLEINARLGANFACALDCGLDLPLWWVRQNTADVQPADGPDPPQDNPFTSLRSGEFSYPINRRYTWLYGDLLGLKQAFSAGRLSRRQAFQWIGNLLIANLRSSTHITFRWSDPLPTGYVFCELLRGPCSRLFQRTVNRIKRTRWTLRRLSALRQVNE